MHVGAHVELYLATTKQYRTTTRRRRRASKLRQSRTTTRRRRRVRKLQQTREGGSTVVPVSFKNMYIYVVAQITRLVGKVRGRKQPDATTRLAPPIESLRRVC